MNSEIILVVLWLAYGFIHTLLASNTLKNLLKSILGRFSAYYRILYNVLSTILLIPIIQFQFSNSSKILLEQSLMNQILGGLMMGSGIFLGISALKHYDLSEFLGIDELKGKIKPKVLMVDELSSIVRHPLYLGILVTVWGYFGFFGTSLGLTTAVALTVYIRIGIYFEEKKLVEVYGKTYQKYQKEVPMLIPKLGDGK
jgi:protein-S-isoprenylcysteine O-methyltransferase Ste14